MVLDSYALMGQLGLVVLTAFLVLTLGAVVLRVLWHFARGAARLAIGLIRLPLDFLARILHEA